MAERSMVVYLFIFCLSIAAATVIREYNALVAISVPPTETTVSWLTLGILLPEWQHGIAAASGLGTPYAPYLGLLIAGQAEFPWLVDVVNTDLSEELWGVGNLISEQYVATVGHLFLEWSIADRCGPSESSSYRVRYCTNYIYEDWYKYQESFDSDIPIERLQNGADSSGVRVVQQLIKHPSCRRFSREWDLMLVRISPAINPLPPEIGYIPLPHTFAGILSRWIKGFPIEELNRRVCYVATFGKPFRDLPKPVNKDFKTKYRVYPTDWSVCRKSRSFLCALDGNYVDLTAEFFFDQGSEPLGNEQLQCWEMRNYEGAICQHDHGAPVVCNGEVVGFVVRGVNLHLCRSGSPFPFVVVKANTFSASFFRNELDPAPTPTPPMQTTPYIIPLQNFTRELRKEINWQKYAPLWKN